MFVLHFEANHNKDYSVVKTSKAGQLAFFYAFKNKISLFIKKTKNGKNLTSIQPHHYLIKNNLRTVFLILYHIYRNSHMFNVFYILYDYFITYSNFIVGKPFIISTVCTLTLMILNNKSKIYLGLPTSSAQSLGSFLIPLSLCVVTA